MDNTARRMQIRSSSLESNRYSNEHRKHDVGQIPSSRSFRNLRSFGGSSGILRYSNWRIHAGVARISVRSLHAMSRFSLAHLYQSLTRAENIVIIRLTSLLIRVRQKRALARFSSLLEQILLPSPTYVQSETFQIRQTFSRAFLVQTIKRETMNRDIFSIYQPRVTVLLT